MVLFCSWLLLTLIFVVRKGSTCLFLVLLSGANDQHNRCMFVFSNKKMVARYWKQVAL